MTTKIQTSIYIEDRSVFMAGEMCVFVCYVDMSIDQAIYLKPLQVVFIED